jgi:hypothetical protein
VFESSTDGAFPPLYLSSWKSSFKRDGGARHDGQLFESWANALPTVEGLFAIATKNED